VATVHTSPAGAHGGRSEAPHPSPPRQARPSPYDAFGRCSLMKTLPCQGPGSVSYSITPDNF